MDEPAANVDEPAANVDDPAAKDSAAKEPAPAASQEVAGFLTDSSITIDL